jgi:hypothetical protein
MPLGILSLDLAFTVEYLGFEKIAMIQSSLLDFNRDRELQRLPAPIQLREGLRHKRQELSL